MAYENFGVHLKPERRNFFQAIVMAQSLDVSVSSLMICKLIVKFISLLQSGVSTAAIMY